LDLRIRVWCLDLMFSVWGIFDISRENAIGINVFLLNIVGTIISISKDSMWEKGFRLVKVYNVILIPKFVFAKLGFIVWKMFR